MSRSVVGALLVGAALVAGLGLRLARLDARPMHHDEANQALKFGALLERGEYHYDARDHHGPTLYYLTLPSAWLRGQPTIASLDERTLRGVTALAGGLTIALLPLLSAGIGTAAVVASAWLLALSPAMVFYSRMYIQEPLFAGFTIAFVIALGRVAVGGGLGWAACAGLAAGLAVSTKETSAIVLPTAVVACLGALWSLGRGRPSVWLRDRSMRWAAITALLVAAVVAGLFYSSFLTAPRGVLQPFLGAGIYLSRGMEPAAHAHPWHYYLGLLAYSSDGGLRWSEGAILALALVGVSTAWTRPDAAAPDRAFWARYLAAYAVLATAIFSAIPYKTPWNLLPFYAGVIVVAGLGFGRLMRLASPVALRLGLTVALVAACAHLGWQAWRASVTYSADPRNPYVYVQTFPDAVRMTTRIRDLSALDSHGIGMQVSVIAQPYEQWPMPWYLRAMPNVGYWTAPGDPVALQAPVIVAALDQAPALDAALGDRYVTEYYGLRPDVLLALYVEKDLWERYLARVAGGPVPCPPGLPPSRCGHPRPVAM
jgi:uncharacterized protein (TIGR03663 family)